MQKTRFAHAPSAVLFATAPTAGAACVFRSAVRLWTPPHLLTGVRLIHAVFADVQILRPDLCFLDPHELDGVMGPLDLNLSLTNLGALNVLLLLF